MIKNLFVLVLEALLACWKLIGPVFLGCRCRFYPTCSEYAVTSIKDQGIMKGGMMAIKRLLSCHPLSK